MWILKSPAGHSGSSIPKFSRKLGADTQDSELIWRCAKEPNSTAAKILVLMLAYTLFLASALISASILVDSIMQVKTGPDAFMAFIVSTCCGTFAYLLRKQLVRDYRTWSRDRAWKREMQAAFRGGWLQ